MDFLATCVHLRLYASSSFKTCVYLRLRFGQGFSNFSEEMENLESASSDEVLTHKIGSFPNSRQ